MGAKRSLAPLVGVVNVYEITIITTVHCAAEFAPRSI
jgi:hypothetical protein